MLHKVNEVPAPSCNLTDGCMEMYSRQNHLKPWRVAYHKPLRGPAKWVIVDADDNIVSGRAAFLRICRLVNTTEG